ncbi:PAS domain-containing hybrid sensor histidine kinase/response regulator [Desulfobacter curvatus]|uniref:PAS domain-containing hybrid sensor histidine kinase/response regulator n=1 Tax=Desulfobacter curvatus TaxID=2290 RepID=UPI000367C588|nr:PAS domain-containing sensor histidine kinase [Desulfobacter curvatus]
MKNIYRLFLKERISIKISFIYAAFSALYIIFSDQILFFFVKNSENITIVQSIKGFAFILISALIIFFLLRREIQKYVQTEKKLQAIFNHRFQLTGLLDVNGRLIMANDMFCNMVGVNCSELVGKYIWELPLWSHSKEQQLKIKKSIQMVKEGKSINFETTHVDTKGDKQYIEFSLTPVHDDNGNMVYIVPEGKDITEKKQSEKKLIESERNYREIYNSSSDAIILHDVETGKIMDVNQTMLDMYGYAHHEVLEFNVGDISYSIDPYTQEEAVKKLKKSIDEGPQLFEWKARHKSGNCFWVEVAFRNTEIGGKGRVLAVVRDISERVQYEKEQKKLENQLVQAQKMEAIGTLAGGIAHDFNNILFPIMGHSEMLLEDLPKDDPARSRVRQIHSGAIRAKELIQQILTFSRQEETEMRLMKIQPVLKETMKMLRSTIPTTIEIQEKIDPGCGPVIADPIQIQQIIINLITNAYHAMENSGGTLSVGLKETNTSEHSPHLAPGRYACLIVSDTGTGIPKEIKESIFDPFFTTKKNGKGTGLGLSVVHGIVAKMKGDIHINSQPGEGSEFKIYFPVEKKTLHEKDSISESDIPSGTEHILLVDDEPEIIAIEKNILERLGYTVTSRMCSIDALEVFQSRPDKFDLVITDYSMPKMAGDQIAQELLKIRPDIRIMVCTGSSNRISKETAEQKGIRTVLEKPFTKKQFATKIREVLEIL